MPKGSAMGLKAAQVKRKPTATDTDTTWSISQSVTGRIKDKVQINQSVTRGVKDKDHISQRVTNF